MNNLGQQGGGGSPPCSLQIPLRHTMRLFLLIKEKHPEATMGNHSI